MIKAVILADDKVRRRGLVAEHGLSIWIEKDDKSILFDTGQSSVFRHNADYFGIDLTKTDYVVISHGHYDHIGGLRYFPDCQRPPKIYIHPDALMKKFAATDENEPSRDVGIPFDIAGLNWARDRVVKNRHPLKIHEGIMVSGEIPCSTSFEDMPKDFFMKKDGRIIHDMMLDEQMLIVEDEGEAVVFAGCSHPGIINCLKYAQRLVKGKRIRLLVAGMHMENASVMQLQMTIQYIVDMGVGDVVPLHCSGFETMCEMKRILGDRCHLLSTGDIIE